MPTTPPTPTVEAKSIRSVAQLDVIAEIGNVVAHERFQRLALGADLKRTFRIRCDRHIEVWHGEKRVRGAARTKLYQRVRLHAAGSFVNLAKEIGQRFHGIFRCFVVVGGIVARRNRVHVLAIEFEAIESPLAQNLANQRFVVFHNRAVGRTHVKRVPPGNLPLRSILVQQKEIGMLFQQLRIRDGAQRRPPQLRFESLGVNAIDQRFHVSVAMRKLL